ncbi:choice-of-anchor D domain-containing protein [Solimonas soli]|uniref:choice-of-anchor D domain-containing protein n=1 Tax=Solimonas soli TaxID=413479 RepID=UPI000485E7E5|nr:choice-of-anchor D domain-containing protein [Solimonas soli]
MRVMSWPAIAGGLLSGGIGLALATDSIGERYAPVLVSDPAAAAQDLGYGLAVDARGNFVAAWTEQGERNGGTWFDVLIRRVSFDGTPLAAAAPIDDATGVQRLYPAIASDAEGNFVVAWGEAASADLQNLTIHARRFAADGSPLGAATLISTVDTQADGGPQIAANAAGDHVIAWFRKGTPTVAVARVFSATGAAVGPEFALPVLDGTNPRLDGIALSDDRRVIVAAALGVQSGGDDLRLQCFSDQGSPVAGAMTVIAASPDVIPDGNHGALAATPDGRIFVSWPQTRVDNMQGKVFSELQLQAVAADCMTPGWHATPLSLPGSEGSVSAAALVTRRDGGELMLGWAFEGAQAAAFARHYGSDGSVLSDAIPVVGNMTSVSAPQLAMRRHGFSAVWSQASTASLATYTDVYARGFFTASAPDPYLSAPTIDFGNQSVGVASMAQAVSVTNDGNTPLVIASVTASGDFAVSANGCSTAVAPQASCTIAVIFTPGAAGARAGDLEIVSNADDSPASVTLTGTGVAGGTGGGTTGGDTTGGGTGGDSGDGNEGENGGAMPWPLLAGLLAAAALRRRRGASRL